MTIFDPATDLDALHERLTLPYQWVVACYCAAWCDTCRAYQPLFEHLAATRPNDVFLWIDIEESDYLLDDQEVENFPTLLLQGAQGNVFFGPMLPHIEHLEKLLERLDHNTPAQTQGPGPLAALLASA